MFLTIHRENYSKERGGIFIFSFARTKKKREKLTLTRSNYARNFD